MYDGEKMFLINFTDAVVAQTRTVTGHEHDFSGSAEKEFVWKINICLLFNYLHAFIPHHVFIIAMFFLKN